MIIEEVLKREEVTDVYCSGFTENDLQENFVESDWGERMNMYK